MYTKKIILTNHNNIKLSGYCGTNFSPLPTFLKNKKKRKSANSDVSDMEHTPPASPGDDSLVRLCLITGILSLGYFVSCVGSELHCCLRDVTVSCYLVFSKWNGFLASFETALMHSSHSFGFIK